MITMKRQYTVYEKKNLSPPSVRDVNAQAPPPLSSASRVQARPLTNLASLSCSTTFVSTVWCSVHATSWSLQQSPNRLRQSEQKRRHHSLPLPGRQLRPILARGMREGCWLAGCQAEALLFFASLYAKNKKFASVLWTWRGSVGLISPSKDQCLSTVCVAEST